MEIWNRIKNVRWGWWVVFLTASIILVITTDNIIETVAGISVIVFVILALASYGGWGEDGTEPGVHDK